MATRKAKRKLTEIDFSKEGAHVALVSKDQGGPANGHDYSLILKANNFSNEFIQKMQQVRVTMELPDFLQKFFYIYGEDAKILATMMGYVEPADTAAMEADEAQSELQDWIKERMSAFEILKSVNEAENLSVALSNLTEEEYLSMLKDQEQLEKALAKIEKQSAPVAKVETVSEESEVVIEQEVPTSVNKGNKMDEELVQKSALEAVQKANTELKTELQKALDVIKAFEQKEKEAKNKARFEKLKSAVGNEESASVLFKAANLVESDEDFDAVVATLASMQELVNKSGLFNEAGASVEPAPQTKEDPLVAAIKKQHGLK